MTAQQVAPIPYSDFEKQVRAKAPAIIFIDELEHARRRQDGGGDADRPDDFEQAGNRAAAQIACAVGQTV